MTTYGDRFDIDKELDETEKIRNEIFVCCCKLGYTKSWDNLYVPKYLLPLGGARKSNLIRCEYAKTVYDKYNDKNIKVVALSSNRVLAEKELKDTYTFARGASTEFDAINGGMEKAFGLNNRHYIKKIFTDNNNDNWGLVFWDSVDDFKCYSLSTPYRNGNRANTRDTFKHFLSEFDVKPGTIISLVSNSIYGPYQFISLLKIAFENNIILQFEGMPTPINNGSLATYYLSEVKASINAMYNFVEETNCI